MPEVEARLRDPGSGGLPRPAANEAETCERPEDGVESPTGRGKRLRDVLGSGAGEGVEVLLLFLSWSMSSSVQHFVRMLPIVERNRNIGIRMRRGYLYLYRVASPSLWYLLAKARCAKIGGRPGVVEILVHSTDTFAH